MIIMHITHDRPQLAAVRLLNEYFVKPKSENKKKTANRVKQKHKTNTVT